LEAKNKIDFFLVGAARCGTTTLYNYLKNHEAVFLPNVKEPNYFSQVESPKKEDYALPEPNIKYHAKIIKSESVYNALYRNAKDSQLKGDSSPSYIWDRDAAKKIYKHNPKAKIIISLRHPVDRAYSHYIMNYYTGVETNKSFSEALKSEPNTMWGSCNQYLEMSAYYEQVKVYCDLFPKDQIKILVYEDWISNMKDEVDRIFEFLKIEPSKAIYNLEVNNNKMKPIKKMRLLNMLRQNSIKAVIKKVISQEHIDNLKASFFNKDGDIQKIDAELRSNLSSTFENEIKKLSELTNIDFKKKWL
jgi:hypothetical protein